MQTFADAVEQLTAASAGGFDFGGQSGQAEKLIQEAIKRHAARSQWIRAQLELGPIVADTASYSLPAKIVRLWLVTIGDIEYGRRDLRTAHHLGSGSYALTYNSEGGVFFETFAEDGKTRQVELFPTPDEEQAGETLEGFASIVPDDLEAGDELPFPEQYRRAVVNYAKATATADVDVDKATGDAWLAQAENESEALRLYANSRSGSGPWKIPVAGHRRR